MFWNCATLRLNERWVHDFLTLAIASDRKSRSEDIASTLSLKALTIVALLSSWMVIHTTDLIGGFQTCTGSAPLNGWAGNSGVAGVRIGALTLMHACKTCWPRWRKWASILSGGVFTLCLYRAQGRGYD